MIAEYRNSKLEVFASPGDQVHFYFFEMIHMSIHFAEQSVPEVIYFT